MNQQVSDPMGKWKSQRSTLTNREVDQLLERAERGERMVRELRGTSPEDQELASVMQREAERSWEA